MNFSKEELISYAAILVIVVSLASIGVQLTGYALANDTAVVNVTISTQASLTFDPNFLDFGVGGVNTTGAVLDTEGTVTGGTWSATNTGLMLNNTGNVNLSVGFYADKIAGPTVGVDFIGGTNPTFQYKVSDSTGACVGNTATAYTNFTTSNVTACTNFPFADGNDSLDLDIRLYIPSDSFTGEQTATITAHGFYV